MPMSIDRFQSCILGVSSLAFLLLLPAWAGAQAPPQSTWFTVTGNPRDPTVNTVQVDPVALATDPEGRKTLNVRVSRSGRRTNWDGIAYRSYESQVAFDCGARKGQYVAATYYMAPLWAGDPHHAADYAADPRPMLFRDVEPNPTERIVRAACRARAG